MGWDWKEERVSVPWSVVRVRTDLEEVGRSGLVRLGVRRGGVGMYGGRDQKVVFWVHPFTETNVDNDKTGSGDYDEEGERREKDRGVVGS